MSANEYMKAEGLSEVRRTFLTESAVHAILTNTGTVLLEAGDNTVELTRWEARNLLDSLGVSAFA